MIDDTSFETHRQQDAKDQIRQLGRIIVGQHDEIVAMAKLAVLLKQDIAEKDAEIEALRAVVEEFSDHGVAAERMALLKRQQEELERLKHLAEERMERLKIEMQTTRLLKTLCVRAADALEKYTSYPIGMAMSVTLRESGRALIAELRKAAE